MTTTTITTKTIATKTEMAISTAIKMTTITITTLTHQQQQRKRLQWQKQQQLAKAFKGDLLLLYDTEIWFIQMTVWMFFTMNSKVWRNQPPVISFLEKCFSQHHLDRFSAACNWRHEDMLRFLAFKNIFQDTNEITRSFLLTLTNLWAEAFKMKWCWIVFLREATKMITMFHRDASLYTLSHQTHSSWLMCNYH